MINFASNLNKMINAGLGGPLDPPRTEVAVGHRVIYTEASGAVASFETNVIAPVKNLRVTMEPIQTGSGDPSPENIRPITGRDSVTVTRTGINVWDEVWELGGIASDTGVNTANTDRIRSKNYVPVVPGTSYYFITPTRFGVRWYALDKTYISGVSAMNEALTAPDNAYFMRFVQTDTTVYGNNISINYPSTDHDYHAYDGQSATIQLGQTVYGGTVDVTTGTMTVDRAERTFDGTENYNDNYFPIIVCTTPLSPIGNYSKRNEVISNFTKYPNVGFASLVANSVQFGRTDTIWNVSNGAEFKSKVAELYTNGTPLTVCYPLATPQTIQLTPAQLSTLHGQNNVWSDADSVSVEYPYYEETEGY